MKTNRQKVQQKTFGQHLAYRQKNRQHLHEKHTLASLFSLGVENQIVKIVCKQQLTVVCQPKTSSLGISQKPHKNIYLRGGIGNALQECLTNWQMQPTQTYIFAPTHPPESVRSFRTSQCDLGKNMILAKTASETAFNFYTQKQPSLNHTESTPSLNQSQKQKRLFSQKPLNTQ